jgi:hypothetical protein
VSGPKKRLTSAKVAKQTKRQYMRKLVFLLLFLIPIMGIAQILKERRVYYLDCSYSMSELNLWDEVRDNLKNAIDNVFDETTELIVIPFANNTSKDPVLKPIKALATKEGKLMLKKKINELSMSKSTMTYHYIPFYDFYANRVEESRVTYMFLMTDGKDEDQECRTKYKLLPQWGVKYGDKNVFGFYVMLHKEAKDSGIEKIIDSQKHLWKVETADVNINLVRLQSNAILNIKNDQYFDLPIYGDSRNLKFIASFEDSCPIKVNKLEKDEKKLRIWIKADKKMLPNSSDVTLNVKLAECGQYDFLVTDQINVKCENKPERSLKISLR